MNIVEKAEMVAELLHCEQKYGDFPYKKHLGDVVGVLKENNVDDENILASAWLHDVLEDTQAKYKLLEKFFNHDVAENVYCVTDEQGKNRRERHEKTYPKLRANQRAVVVKLADRTANTRNCIKTGNQMIYMYATEYPNFKYSIREENISDPKLAKWLDDMWRGLDDLYSKVNLTKI